jgi:hypothetical protein
MCFPLHAVGAKRVFPSTQAQKGQRLWPQQGIKRVYLIATLVVVSTLALLWLVYVGSLRPTGVPEDRLQLICTGQAREEVEQLMIVPGTILTKDAKEALAVTCGTPRERTAYWEMWNIRNGQLFIAFDARDEVVGSETHTVNVHGYWETLFPDLLRALRGFFG